MTSTRFWHALGAVAVTAVVVAVLWRWIDVGALADFLSPHRLPGITAAGAFFVLVNVVRGVRIARLTTRHLGVPVGIASGVGLATVTNLANHVLPLRLGEVLYIALSRSLLGVPLTQATGVLLSIRVYDLLGLTLLAVIGLTQAPWLARDVSVPVFLALAALLLVVATRLDLVFALASRLVRGAAARALREALPFVRQPRFVAASLGYALLVWSVQAVGFAFLLRAFGIDVAPAPMVVATSIANLAAVLPVSAFGTFGALEAGWAAGFVAVGVPASIAATSGLAGHLVMVAANALMALGFVGCLGHVIAKQRNSSAAPPENVHESR